MALLCEHPSLSDEERSTVGKLLKDYPAPHQVRAWMEEDVELVPGECAKCIEEAGNFLRDLDWKGRCPDELKRFLVFALRHYPQRGQAIHWSDRRRFGPAARWLLPEDFYDR